MQHRNLWGVVALGIVGLQVVACGGPSAAAKVQAVKIEPIEGSSFKRLTLTDDAVKRLGIEVAPLREEQTTRRRLIGGEIFQPAGVFAVRVRLSVSDYEAVDATVPVRVLPGKVSAGVPARTVIAQPVPAPPVSLVTGPAAAVLQIPVDFTLQGVDHGFGPAEKVMVEVALKGSGMRKAIPYSALVYEINGETWVYTNPESRVFVRGRAVVDYIDGNRAVLRDGPPAGTQIVSVGATELYGAEFRTGK